VKWKEETRREDEWKGKESEEREGRGCVSLVRAGCGGELET